jgi:hypothetical protein
LIYKIYKNGCNEKNVRLKTQSKYGIVVVKEGLSTNGCKEVKKSVLIVLVWRLKEMVNSERYSDINVNHVAGSFHLKEDLKS